MRAAQQSHSVAVAVAARVTTLKFVARLKADGSVMLIPVCPYNEAFDSELGFYVPLDTE